MQRPCPSELLFGSRCIGCICCNVSMMLALLSLLGCGAALGSTPDVGIRDQAPSIHLPSGVTLKTVWHEQATPETITYFQNLLPFSGFVVHTVSSGQNLVILMPALGDKLRLQSQLGASVAMRRPGLLCLRHDAMVVLTYGSSQDHGYLPPILLVVPEDLPALQVFGEAVWEEQLHGESKKPFTLAFTSLEPLAVGGPLFNDEVTGNRVVDDAVVAIRSETVRHWLVPPQEVAQLMTTGDALGLEGTKGYIFPPMVIGNGVFMILGSYAHSGAVNILASLLEDDVIAKEDLNFAKKVMRKLGQSNLPYLRALSMVETCNSFENFLDAFEKVETVVEARVLLRAMSLFGAVVHGWFVYLFPYRLGVDLRREAADMFTIEPPISSYEAPLRYREGRGLGMATWQIGSPTDREQVSSNLHLPESLRSNESFPLVVGPQLFAKSSISPTNLAMAARSMIDEELPRRGALVIRGLLQSFEEASSFLSALEYTIYPDPSGREQITGMLCHSSLAVSPDISVAPHQEHITSKNPPAKLFLFAQSPSLQGGETPLAHAADVWAELSEDTQHKLRTRGVRTMMVRGNRNVNGTRGPGRSISRQRRWRWQWPGPWTSFQATLSEMLTTT